MSDFENKLNEWLETAGGLVNFSVEERKEVTQAGGKVLKENIPTVTPKNKHRKLGDLKHLSDSFEMGQMEGKDQDGNTAVGFQTKDINHARIARFLNDGTVKMEATHFLDKGFIQFEDMTYQAINKKLFEIQKRKVDK